MIVKYCLCLKTAQYDTNKKQVFVSNCLKNAVFKLNLRKHYKKLGLLHKIDICQSHCKKVFS